MSKKITVYTTGTGVGKVIETESVNWGQLKTELSKNGVSTSDVKALIGKNKLRLEHPDAVIPDEDFTLFLFPEKTRSGAPVYTEGQIKAMSFSEVRAALKVISNEDEAAFKAWFNVGKNYTVKSTDEVKGLLISWYNKGATPTKGKAKATEAIAKPATKTEVVKAPAENTKPARAKRETVEEAPATTSGPSLKTDDEKINFIIDLISGMTSATSDQKDKAINSIAMLKAGSEVKGAKSSSGSFTTIDNDALRREAESIKRGLSGLK